MCSVKIRSCKSFSRGFPKHALIHSQSKYKKFTVKNAQPEKTLPLCRVFIAFKLYSKERKNFKTLRNTMIRSILN